MQAVDRRFATMRRKRRTGFASMDPARVREIASMGGTAVSSRREHMAEIGAMGGAARRGWRKLAARVAAQLARKI